MKKIKYILVLFCIYISFHNHSLSAEKNVDQISKNLRCLICQGQSVYDSQSDFALSMKQLIQDKINQGVEEDEIYKYLKEKSPKRITINISCFIQFFWYRRHKSF